MCLIFTDSNFCAILRGLYPQGVMIVYTVLYITALLGYFASEEKKRLPYMFATAVSSVLLLRADSHMIVFLPALILMGIYIIIREKNLLSKHLGAAVITIVLSAAYMLPCQKDYISPSAAAWLSGSFRPANKFPRSLRHTPPWIPFFPCLLSAEKRALLFH